MTGDSKAPGLSDVEAPSWDNTFDQKMQATIATDDLGSAIQLLWWTWENAPLFDGMKIKTYYALHEQTRYLIERLFEHHSALRAVVHGEEYRKDERWHLAARIGGEPVDKDRVRVHEHAK